MTEWLLLLCVDWRMRIMKKETAHASFQSLITRCRSLIIFAVIRGAWMRHRLDAIAPTQAEQRTSAAKIVAFDC